MDDINKLAVQFTDYYYLKFRENRAELASLYRPESMLSWEDSFIQGRDGIMEKLINLPFQKVEHVVTTRNAQPSSPTVQSVIVSVTGKLAVDGGNPLQFNEVFHLIPDAATGSFWVLNDIFRLVYS